MKLKKILATAMCVVLMAATLTACGSEGAKETAGTSEGSADKKTFTVGFDKEFPPYGYEEDGEYKGFDLDLAAEDWDSKDMELDSGAIDCIWNGFTMNGREDDYTWTEAYVDNSQVFVVKADSGIKTLADLKGKTVITQADSSALKALESDEQAEFKASLANVDTVPDYNTAFLNLEAGSGDAVAMDIGVANYQIESRGSDKFAMLSEQLATEQYGIGFKKGNEELRDAVQKTLKEMVADGKFEEIAKKYDLTEVICLEK